MPLHRSQQTLSSPPRSVAECLGWRRNEKAVVVYAVSIQLPKLPDSAVTAAVNTKQSTYHKASRSAAVLIQLHSLRKIMTQLPVTASTASVVQGFSNADQLFVRKAEISAAESTNDRRSVTPESQPQWGRPWLALLQDAVVTDQSRRRAWHVVV